MIFQACPEVKILIMKIFHLIFILVVLVITACNNEDDLFKVMPESDILALEGLHEAYDNAVAYNDSLMLCDENPGSCDSSLMIYFDEMFHHFDSLYNFHHGNYSHNNVGDDHHHVGDNGIMDHTGMIDDHEDYVHGIGDHGYMHNSETHELMEELQGMHEDIHP